MIQLLPDDPTPDESIAYAYWERNMLALLLANICFDHSLHAGWYVDPQNKDGWKVISMKEGKITFHVPPDFDCLGLPEIDPDWDGHTVPEKWNKVIRYYEDEYFIDAY